MIEQKPVSGTSSFLSRESATSVDIIKILDKLEELVEDAPQVFGRSLWINTDQFFLQTNKIRTFLPEEMKQASRLSRDSERLVEQAEAHAETIVVEARKQAENYLAEARAKAQELVAEHEIKKLADDHARSIVEAAQNEAMQIRQGADEYAREVLASLDAFVGKILGTIQRGREKLEVREVSATKK